MGAPFQERMFPDWPGPAGDLAGDLRSLSDAEVERLRGVAPRTATAAIAGATRWK